MNFYLKPQLQNELNFQKKNRELLNHLEKKCEGLENFLCKNVINTISRKIDSIENDYNSKLENKIEKSNKENDEIRNNDERNKILMLNENLNYIENSFKINETSNDSHYSDTIREKIEENYKLLNELENTNRPIFTKSTEINNNIFVEDKIKEMDNKLSVLFKRNNEKINTHRNINTFTSSVTGYDFESRTSDTINKINNDKLIKDEKEYENNRKNEKIEKEIRKKELYNRLISTEKRIKEIAGTLLKNF
jgi:hypothetical protein